MPAELSNLESLAPGDIQRLADAGIATTTELFARAARREDRRALASETGIEPAMLDRLAALSDLMRIVGISEPHAQLLATLDAPTAAALATRDAAVLIKQLRRKNVELLLARSMPPESTVARWIDDARKLPMGTEI
jgi:hypothetical protein